MESITYSGIGGYGRAVLMGFHLNLGQVVHILPFSFQNRETNLPFSFQNRETS